MDTILSLRSPFQSPHLQVSYNSYSRPFGLQRGVHQGLVLKPILFSLFIFLLPFFLNLLRSHSTQIILLFGPLRQVLIVQLPLSKLPSTDWWNGPPNGIYLSTLSSVSPFFSLDPYQSRMKLSLSILNTPLTFNPNPTFLGFLVFSVVTLVQTFV